MVLLKSIHFQHLGPILSTVLRDPLPCVPLCAPWHRAHVGNLPTHSTTLHDLAGVRLSRLHLPPASKELACAVARLVLGQQTSPGPCAPPPSSRRRWLRRLLDSRRAEGRWQRRGGGPLRRDPDVPAAAAAARTAGTAAALRLDALRTLLAEGGRHRARYSGTRPGSSSATAQAGLGDPRAGRSG